MRFNTFADLVDSKINDSQLVDLVSIQSRGSMSIQFSDDSLAPNELLPVTGVMACDNNSYWGITPIIDQDFPDSSGMNATPSGGTTVNT